MNTKNHDSHNKSSRNNRHQRKKAKKLRKLNRRIEKESSLNNQNYRESLSPIPEKQRVITKQEAVNNNTRNSHHITDTHHITDIPQITTISNIESKPYSYRLNGETRPFIPYWYDPMMNVYPLTSEMLRDAKPAEKKRLIGNRLYLKIQVIEPRLAAKITGMLLELDNTELLVLLCEQRALISKVNDALIVLNDHDRIRNDNIEINDIITVSKQENKNNSVTNFDQKSKDIVFGFIKQIQQILSRHYVVPIEVSRLCLFYIDDHFMLNQGTFQWIIDDKLYNKFISTKNGDFIESPVFEIGKLPWKICMYPRGQINLPGVPGSVGVDIMINLLSLPSDWKQIGVRLTIKCLEIAYSLTHIHSYGGNGRTRFGAVGIPLNEIIENVLFNSTMYEKKMTVLVKLHIVNIFSVKNQIYYETKLNYQNRRKYEWKIEGKLLELMKQSPIQKCFESRVFDDMWCLTLCPNGTNIHNINKFEILLNLCALPPDIIKLPVRFNIYIKEMNKYKEHWNEFSYSSSYFVESTLLPFGEINKYDSLTILVEIIIYDNNDVLNEWKQYIEKKDPVSKLMDNVNKIMKEIEILNYNMRINKDNMLNDDVVCSDINNAMFEWLKETVKLPQYYSILVNNGFDRLDFLQNITKHDLIEIGIDKIGHQKRIIQCIQNLKQ